jgi:hypothetical protein
VVRVAGGELRVACYVLRVTRYELPFDFAQGKPGCPSTSLRVGRVFGDLNFRGRRRGRSSMRFIVLVLVLVFGCSPSVFCPLTSDLKPMSYQL